MESPHNFGGQRAVLLRLRIEGQALPAHQQTDRVLHRLEWSCHLVVAAKKLELRSC